VAAVLCVAGCTSADRVHLSPHPPSPSARPPCTGEDGEAVFRALLVDLNYGRPVVLSDYFTPADRFVRWIDPETNGALTELPDPADGHPSLDALRDHLDALGAGGFRVTVVNFIDLGYVDNAAGQEGGAFEADLYGHGSAEDPVANGTANGILDCRTGKLRTVKVVGW